MGLVYLIGLTIVAVISIFLETLESPTSSVRTALIPFIGAGACTFMAEYLEGLWPNIEIVPKPKHEQEVQNRRKRIKFFLTSIFVPLIISLVASYFI